MYSFLRGYRIRDLLVSGCAGGLAVLTKSPGISLLPAFGIIAIVMWVIETRSQASTGARSRLWKYVWPLLLWIAVATLTFVLFWPAIWIAPHKPILSILVSAQDYAEAGHSYPLFFNGTIFEDGQIGPSYVHFYPLTYLWRTSPIVIIGLIFAGLGYLAKVRPFDKSENNITALCILLFVIVYTVAMTAGTKKFDRYLLPVYSPLSIIAALGWACLWYGLSGSTSRALAKYGAPLILSAAVAVHAIGAVRAYPYFLSYYNPVMGGSKTAPDVMQIGWGEGLDLAAHYLNQKENAEDLHVVSWYADGAFSYFFAGDASTFTLDKLIRKGKQTIEPDYAVVYVHQWQRGIPQSIDDFLSHNIPEHTIRINGIEYAKIYNLMDID